MDVGQRASSHRCSRTDVLLFSSILSLSHICSWIQVFGASMLSITTLVLSHSPACQCICACKLVSLQCVQWNEFQLNPCCKVSSPFSCSRTPPMKIFTTWASVSICLHIKEHGHVIVCVVYGQACNQQLGTCSFDSLVLAVLGFSLKQRGEKKKKERKKERIGN